MSHIVTHKTSCDSTLVASDNIYINGFIVYLLCVRAWVRAYVCVCPLLLYFLFCKFAASSTSFSTPLIFFPSTCVFCSVSFSFTWLSSWPGAVDGQGKWLGGVSDRCCATGDERIHTVCFARGWTHHLWRVCSDHQGKWRLWLWYCFK